MSELEYIHDFDPVTRITASAVGKPGQRVFYIQARHERQIVSLLAEKEQVKALSQAIEQLLEDQAESNPLLSSSDDFLPIYDMSLEEPLEPLFRVAQIRLGYDPNRDMLVLVLMGAPEEEAESETPMSVRFSATRQQMRALAQHASEVVARGRRICGNCARPIDPGGHFCPRMN
ncbi:MAG TPA: DUF3090 family protein [Roseiflexaceae bacterium]|nr:DUF3090 family protein [Roseiflexaceae bacterium]